MSLPVVNENLVLSDNEVIEIEHIVQFGITIDDEQIKKNNRKERYAASRSNFQKRYY